MADLDDYLLDLGREYSWGILLLQEFSSALKVPDVTSAGHLVMAQSLTTGQRRTCIIIHNNLAGLPRGEFISRGRHIGVDIQGGNGCSVRFISGHLPANQIDDDYSDSIADLQYIIDGRPNGYQVVMGVDAQEAVGGRDGENHFSDFFDLGVIGELTKGRCGTRGEILLNFMEFNGLSLRNTFGEGAEGIIQEDCYTCNYDLRRLPKQIDYVASSLRRVTARVVDATATSSDHRPIYAFIPWESFLPTGATMAAQRERKKKPIGWIKSNQNYNLELQKGLGLESVLNRAVEGGQKITIYSDGSKRTKDTRRGFAGWAFACFYTDPTNINDTPFKESFGRVANDSNDKMFLGAKVQTSCVGEVCAVIEAGLFILASIADGTVLTGAEIIIRPDATYACGLISGWILPKENLVLAKLCTHIWNRIRKFVLVKVLKVNAHTGNIGNDYVDALAKKGANPDFIRHHCDKRVRLRDWGAAEFFKFLVRSEIKTQEVDNVITVISHEEEENEPALKRARRIHNNNFNNHDNNDRHKMTPKACQSLPRGKDTSTDPTQDDTIRHKIMQKP